MKAKYTRVAPEVKCPCCGWQTDRLYFLGLSQEDSVGMCADCFAEWIVEMEYEIMEVKQ